MVALILVMGVYLLYHDLSSLISQERSTLAKTAYTMARLIPEAQIELATLTKNSQSPNDSQLQDRLFALQNEMDISGNIALITVSDSPEVIASTRLGLRKGDKLSLESRYTEEGIQQKILVSDFYRRDDAFRLSAVAPIRNAGGQRVASLVLEVNSSPLIYRLFGYGLHYVLLAVALLTIGGFLFIWLSNRTSRSLKRIQERYFTLFHESSDGILILNTQCEIQKANDAALQSFQREKAQLIGRNLTQADGNSFTFIPLEPSRDIQNLTLLGGTHFTSKAKLLLPNERVRYLNYSSYPLRDQKKIAGALILFQDITSDFVREQELQHHSNQLKKENEILQQVAMTDALTGCFNRQYLYIILDDRNLRWLSSEACSILMIDLDNFKKINDNEGHQRGDQVLKAFGKFLGSFFRRSDKIIRFGGDEFIVILSGNNLESAQRIAKNFLEKMKTSFSVSSGTNLAASVGVAELQKNESGEAWLKRADQALYRAKRGGRSIVEVSRMDQLEIIG